MIKVTADQYKAILCTNLTKKAKFSKYKAIPTKVDGIRFHSKKEAEYYKKLKDQQQKGEIVRFHPQVTFLLPGGIRHHVDFQVIIKCVYWPPLYPDLGTVKRIDYEKIEYHEVKGRDTPIGKLKRKQCEDIYGIEIKLI